MPKAVPKAEGVRKVGLGFLVLSAVLVAYSIRQAVREPWMGDFWGHAAIVRELAAHPWSPGHPELAIEAPHAFISPYSLLVAGIARLAGVDAVQALGIAGVLNVVLLLAGVRLFVELVSPGPGKRASFYALLFVLLLWGRHPWVYSGVFNLLSLGYVIPYPSTFAAGLALVTAFVWGRRLPTVGPAAAVFTALAAATLLITHPPTWFFLLAAMAAFAIATKAGIGAWLGLGFAALGSVGLALLWPYFPVLKLVLSDQSAFHASNKFMYERVLSRVFPVLVAIPLVAWRLRGGWRDPIFLAGATLFVFYAYGRLSGQWNYGRSLPWLIFLGQVQIASSLALWEERPGAPTRLRRLAPVVVTAACVAFAFAWQIRPVFEVTRTDKNVRAAFGFLGEATGPYDVVLTDFDNGWYVPAFGGKVVASRHPIAFVSGHQDRVRDVRRFFGTTAEQEDLMAIVDRWNARFILLDRQRPESAGLRSRLVSFGAPVVENDRWWLIRVRR